MADKKLFQQAGLEMVAIVFSVMLALLLNDWWQDHRTEVAHRQTLILIEAELNTNRADLEEAIAYYQDIGSKIGAVLQDGVTDDEAREVMEYCCELMSGGTGRTAHEMAVITGLYSWLAPDVAATLFAPFVGQEDLKDFISAFTSGLMTTDPTDADELFRRYYIFATSLKPSLEELLELTITAIAAIENLE